MVMAVIMKPDGIGRTTQDEDEEEADEGASVVTVSVAITLNEIMFDTSSERWMMG